jgi:hypothetical protein
MPDLNPDGTVHVPDALWAAEERRRAIQNCGLCDVEGYLADCRVCDHVDHSEANARGRALVLAELEKIRQRRTEGPA